MRDVAKRVLEGQTLRALCADLANRGVTRAEGQPWDPNLLLRTLLNPYVGGYRSHLGEVVAKGTWKPLLRASVWHAVRVELEGGGRVNHGQSGHLLSGIIECGGCGHRLASRTQPGVLKGRAGYVCRHGCDMPPVRAVDVEAEVVALIERRIHLTVEPKELATARAIINKAITRLTITPTRGGGQPNLDIQWRGTRPHVGLTVH